MRRSIRLLLFSSAAAGAIAMVILAVVLALPGREMHADDPVLRD